ncbi:cobalt-zinc-cadmium efflux system outer membrane protein [Sphingopyxis sp. OAS728]|uniref:TolC family protein n=1 Tax=Sphingopyxis sp. OAS728 TaxID=2663823 RepID=UPI0017893E28|nr:TolC family protein [Sphingopyxis sp. OAS728]MBE1526685.1 cobalt-zinc-cadmium efflux system outer membrane protein [Sphingopyxis sp. OAS728]
MKSLWAAMLAAPLCVLPAQAQSSPASAGGDILTLDEALADAGVATPLTQAAQAGVWAAEAGRTVAGLRPNPSVSVDTENALGTGPYRGFDESDTTIAFAMPVELGGKRSARVAVADAKVRRASIDLAIAEADRRVAVTEAYVAAIASGRRAQIAEAQVAVTTENLRIARDRVMVGANSPIDEQRAVLEQVRATTEAETTRRTAMATRAALAQYVGDGAGSALDQGWFDSIGMRGQGPAAPVDARGTLAFVAAAADALSAEAELRMARSQRAPDLTLTAGTRRLEASNDQAMVFGVSVPLPLFNGGKAAVTQAARQRDRAEAQQRIALFEAERAIAAAAADRDRAATAVRAAEPAVAAATEAARIARIGYAEGKFDQLILLDAERTLLDTRRAGIDARAAWHEAAARLERLTARLPAEGEIK